MSGAKQGRVLGGIGRRIVSGMAVAVALVICAGARARPMDLRIERLLARERARFGDRLLPGGDMADEHREFMAWTRGYDDGTSEGTNTLPIHEAILCAASCEVLRLEGRIEATAAADRVLRHL